MRKLTIKPFILITLLLVSTSSMAKNFGPWPHQYFNGLLSCSTEGASCLPGEVSDLKNLKMEWLSLEQLRLERIERVSELARKKAEKVLMISNKELSTNDESLIGPLYMELGSKLLENIGERRIERARLLVSQSSPVFLKMIELEGKLTSLQNQAEEEQDLETKEALLLQKNEKYREWISGKSFRDPLDTLELFQKEFFPTVEKENFEKVLIDGMMDLRIELADHISFDECPASVKETLSKQLGGIQYSEFKRTSNDWDPVKDVSFLRFILDGNSLGGSLKVTCQKASTASEVGASYKKSHTLVVQYHLKSGRIDSKSNQVPTRKELLKVLK